MRDKINIFVETVRLLFSVIFSASFIICLWRPTIRRLPLDWPFPHWDLDHIVQRPSPPSLPPKPTTSLCPVQGAPGAHFNFPSVGNITIVPRFPGKLWENIRRYTTDTGTQAHHQHAMRDDLSEFFNNYRNKLYKGNKCNSILYIITKISNQILTARA